MKRDSEARLLEFCARQRRGFCAAEWLEFPMPREEVAAAALLLASSGWFGHRHELLAVAAELGPGAALPDLVRQTEFDCPRFSNMLQRLDAHVTP